MSSLEVDLTGLSMLAAGCETAAASVARPDTSPSTMGTFVASDQAVIALHAATESAASRVSERLQSTAGRLRAAAAGFAHTERVRAASLAAVEM